MHFTKLFTVAAIVTTGVLAAPGGANKPPPPPPKPTSTTVAQSNACGNGATPYCCTTDGFAGYASCYLIGAQNSVCSATTVCCNANNSIQVCLGNAVIVV